MYSIVKHVLISIAFTFLHSFESHIRVTSVNIVSVSFIHIFALTAKTEM